MTSRWRTAMRRAMSVDGGLDGVPMLLVLCDERRAAEPPAAERPGAGSLTRDDIPDLLDECRAELAPTARDDDLGITAMLLATVAADELGTPPSTTEATRVAE